MAAKEEDKIREANLWSLVYALSQIVKLTFLIAGKRLLIRLKLMEPPPPSVPVRKESPRMVRLRETRDPEELRSMLRDLNEDRMDRLGYIQDEMGVGGDPERLELHRKMLRTVEHRIAELKEFGRTELGMQFLE